MGILPPHKGCAKLCSDETKLAAVLSAAERTCPSPYRRPGSLTAHCATRTPVLIWTHEHHSTPQGHHIPGPGLDLGLQK